MRPMSTSFGRMSATSLCIRRTELCSAGASTKNAELGSGDYDFDHVTPVPVQAPIEVVLNGESMPLNNGVIARSGQAFLPLRSIFGSWERASLGTKRTRR
ncbi:hypothetical protein [Cohnella zeiphila]|uniref:Uncharacterized protein n=1 Tax=Cohnella zeiphila TaxID=2761120 RepID=A0A7X0VUR0_9BACL|nr:hypothetical protein [Cohnella zeiphila]MBB6730537.1 hypothetical protein [Cohnella zeiphila]